LSKEVDQEAEKVLVNLGIEATNEGTSPEETLEALEKTKFEKYLLAGFSMAPKRMK